MLSVTIEFTPNFNVCPLTEVSISAVLELTQRQQQIQSCWKGHDLGLRLVLSESRNPWPI